MPQRPFKLIPPVALSFSAELVGDSCPIPLQSLLSDVSVSGSDTVGRGHHPNISGGWSNPVDLQSMALAEQWEHTRHRGICLLRVLCRSVFWELAGKHSKNLCWDLQSLGG